MRILSTFQSCFNLQYRRIDVDKIFHRVSFKIVDDPPNSAPLPRKTKFSIPHALLPHLTFLRRSLRFLRWIMTTGHCRMVRLETRRSQIGRRHCQLQTTEKLHLIVSVILHRPADTRFPMSKLQTWLHLVHPTSRTFQATKNKTNPCATAHPLLSQQRPTIRH